MNTGILKTLRTGAICAVITLGAQTNSPAVCAGLISTNGRGANMRIGPSTDNKVVAKLDDGAPVVIHYLSNGWYYVTPDYGYGWINGNLVTVWACEQ